MLEELWKSLDFLGYPKYKISNQGKVVGPRGLRKEIFNYAGYRVVDLHNAIGKRQYQVHILVALAFIPNPEQLPKVNHKDGIKKHCESTNLEWCTSQQNTQHAIATGLMPTFGESNPNSKLTQKDVDYIRKHPEISQTILGNQFNVHPTTINKIRRNTLWAR